MNKAICFAKIENKTYQGEIRSQINNFSYRSLSEIEKDLYEAFRSEGVPF